MLKNLLPTLLPYGAVFLVMFALDMLWLRGIATQWYQQGIGHLMTAEPRLLPAALFYLMFPAALMVFAVLPAGTGGLGKAALLGGLLGFVTYATYDLTNLTTLRGWPVGLSLIDVAWGTCVSALSATAGKAALNALQR